MLSLHDYEYTADIFCSDQKGRPIKLKDVWTLGSQINADKLTNENLKKTDR